MRVYFGQRALSGPLYAFARLRGYTRQQFYGVLIGDCFLGVIRWHKAGGAPSQREP